MRACLTVSELAWKEFEELKAENERLQMLQSEAENYAYQVPYMYCIGNIHHEVSVRIRPNL